MENEEAYAQARARLRDLWGAWGMTPDPALGDQQLKAVDAVYDWLGAEEEERIVTATQVLMLDPQTPDAHRTAPAKALAEVVAEVWSTAGTQAGYVKALQGMVLACWPEDAEGQPWDLARLMDPAWDAIRKAPEVLGALRAWRGHPADHNIRPEPTDSAELDSRAYLRSWALWHKAQQNVGLASVRPHLDSILGYLAQQGAGLSNRVAQLEDRDRDLTELVWWGRSKYCHRLAVPYRRLDNPGHLALHLAADVAERAARTYLPFAPTAAFLAEVAHELGLAWDEKRTLRDWLSQVVGPLGAEGHTLGLELEPLTDGRGIGRPVLYLAGGGGATLDKVKADCAVSTDVELDRAEWLRWLLGELTLAYELSRA